MKGTAVQLLGCTSRKGGQRMLVVRRKKFTYKWFKFTSSPRSFRPATAPCPPTLPLPLQCALGSTCARAHATNCTGAT
jgi:hypothetical protein